MSLLLDATSSRLHHRIVKSQQHGLSSHVRVSRTVHTISHAIPAAQPINPTGSSMSEYCDIFDIPSCVNRPAAAAPTLPESLRIEDYLDLAIDPLVEGASSADEDHHTAGALWEDAGPVRYVRLRSVETKTCTWPSWCYTQKTLMVAEHNAQ